MRLYRITKERRNRRNWGARTGEYYIDKHEVVITERKGRATQCLSAAQRENDSGRTYPSGSQYRCLVEILPEGATEFEFMKEVEFPGGPVAS